MAETRKAIPKEYQNEIGRVLCNYGDVDGKIREGR